MKRIVLLSDGTGNSAAKRHKTNVWRLYNALDLQCSDQIAMYDDGVGTQELLLPRLLGGVFGYGLKNNVIQLYKFLCRNYEDGDKIYLFGFSRGAFTVRVLAGLIAECGLPKNTFESERELDEFARRSFAKYRWKRKGCQVSRPFAWARRTLRMRFAEKNQPARHCNVKIEFMGVWDTVAAYGLPIAELRGLWDVFIYPLKFNDTKLSCIVRKACHAISIDDERHSFHPVLWEECCESKENEKSPQRIEQVWFPGVHSDVGGGYPRPELALVSLDWMMSKVEQCPQDSRKLPSEQNDEEDAEAEAPGLIFRPDLRNDYRDRADWNGTQHDSRAGLRAYYRYRPRNIEDLWSEACSCRSRKNACSCQPPKIHRSALERIKARVVPYAPTGLPASYDVVSTYGTSPEFESMEKSKERDSAMDCARDIILLRQWLYFMFLLATAMAVAVPVIVASGIGIACTGATCPLGPMCCDLANALSELAKVFLPEFVDIWIAGLYQMFCKNSNWFWVLVAIFLFLILVCAKMKTSARTFDRAEKAWFHVRHPNGSDANHSGNPTKCRTSATSCLRSPLGRKACSALRLNWWWLASVAIIVAIVLAADRTMFQIRDCVGCICGQSDVRALATGEETVEFKADDPCMETGLELVAGTLYRFEVDEVVGWMDGGLPAGPDGLAVSAPFLMKASTPFRRHLSRPWFELTGRTGQLGGETFPIGSGTCYAAQSSGPLYLYVNDAISGLMPGQLWAFPYHWPLGENKGTATVKITAIGPSLSCEGTTQCASCSSR